MPDEKTHADSIRVYLTGAASDGAAQTDPDASLGKYRSSTEAVFLGHTVGSGFGGDVTIAFVGGANGTGAGTLTASGTSELKWTAPSGSIGAGVAIANGETKILEDAGDTDKYIRVTRTTATNLTGSATITLANELNDVVGFDNVSSAEASAGDTEYRCLMLVNENSVKIEALKAFLKTIGTARAVDAAEYAASGADTITCKANDFSDWPDAGWVKNTDTGEIMYFTSRTATVLTVTAAGRDWDGDGEVAGSEDDVLESISGLRLAKEELTAVSAVAFTGSGLDDATSGGTYTGLKHVDYRVKIDGEGTPDTFTWSNDGGSTWEATGVAITGAAQTLELGVTIAFNATTGHTDTEYWDFNADRVGTDKTGAGEGSQPAGLTWDSPLTAGDGDVIDIGDLEANEMVVLWPERKYIASSTALANVVNTFQLQYDAV
jgi:hypothetical protein